MNSSCLELSTSFRLENSSSFSSVARALHLSIKIHAPLAKDGGMSVFNRSKEILFLIDNSISMEGNRLESSKAAIVQLIQTCISEEDLVGIVKFSSSATVEFPLTQIRSLEKKDAVLCAVRKISANGSTNIQAGLITALSQFQTLSPGEIATRQRIIILLSDGEHNHSDPLNIPQISLLATEKSCHGVYCVGIDHGIDLNTLISISTSCKGQFWSSFDGDQFLSELIKSFSKCFAGISTTVCSSLRLAVAGPTGPPALVGRLFHHSMSKSFKLEETKKENTHQTVLSVEIGQIIIDQSIHLSFYFEFLEASEVNDSDSFRLELSYYNHLTNQLEVQTKQVIAPKYLIGLEKGQHRLVQTSVANGEILQSEIISISDEEFQLENTTTDQFFTLFLSPDDKLELHPSSICVIAKVGSLPKRKSSADHETVSEDAIFSCSLLKGTLYANITSYELEVEDVASDSTKLSLKDSRKVLSSQTSGNRVLLLEKTETSHVLCVDGTVEVPKMKGEDEDKSESKCVEIAPNKTILKSLEGVVFSRRGGTKEETIKLPLPQNAMLTSEFHQPCHAKDLIDILASPNFREEIDHETEENRKFANRYLSVLSEALEKKDKNECKSVSQNLSDLFERSLSTRFEAAMVAASKSGRESGNSTQDFTPLNLPLLLSYQKVRSSVDSYLKAETKTDSESKRREAEIRVQNLFQTVDQERSMLEGDAEAFLYTTPIQQNIADKVLQSTAVQASSGPSAQMMTILQDQEQLMGRQSVKRGLQAFLSDPVAIQRGGSLLVGAEVSQQRRQECQEQIKSSGETVQDRRSRRESKGPTANTFLESNLVTSGHRVDEVKALASGKVGGLRAMFEKKKN